MFFPKIPPAVFLFLIKFKYLVTPNFSLNPKRISNQIFQTDSAAHSSNFFPANEICGQFSLRDFAQLEVRDLTARLQGDLP